MKHEENPAKTFLRSYRAQLMRVDALRRAIDEAMERATDISVQLKPIIIQANGIPDRMAEDVCYAADASGILTEELKKATAALNDVAMAIASVPDEMEKTVLTMRYIEGLDWISIAERIHYEERQTFVIHGRGLMAVNRWMERAQENAVAFTL